jgi:glycosyltransferase involved in cell wall biosynthesis
MKIALIVPGFSRDENDWAIPALQTLATALSHTAELHVFSLRYPAAGRTQLGNVHQHATGGGQRFGLTSFLIWWQTLQAIIREHRRGRPFDILHAFWVDEPGLVAVLAGRMTRRPVIASVGGGELTWLPAIGYGTQGSRFRRWVVAFTLRWANLITAGSPYQLDLCRRRGVPDNRLRPAPLGVDCDQFRPGPLPSWETPTIIQAASLVPVKQQELLLAILGKVKEAIPVVRLILAGDGPLEKILRKSAADQNLAQNIEWRPKTAFPEMARLYQEAHLYLQTSYHESQGMAVLEAMACGLPVLGTPVGLARELACLPAQASAGELAAQVITLFGNKDQYLATRQKARQTVERDFCLPATTKQFLQLYRTLSDS